MTSPTPGPAMRADAVRNREALLAAARSRVARGDTSLSMHVIARDAGVGVGTMYRHFPSRHDLLDALALGQLEDLVDQVQNAIDTLTPGPAMHRVLCMLIETGRDPVVAEVLSTGHAPGAATRALLQDYEDALATLVERARADGQIRTDVSCEDIRRLVCGIQHALLIGENPAGLTELYSEILLAGLRPAGA